ncbi:MAG: ATP-binding protein [Deltaproteobacteria bacterium]|nr:ATP-binding protein [Deltaproteobacteria bacterium]
MSVEKAMIAQAKPYMMAARAQTITQEEARKGCTPDIAPYPVALEPPFRPISPVPRLLENDLSNDFISEPSPPANDILRLQLWPSVEEKFSWLNSELFLKHLHSVSHRVGFEITGNKREIQMRFIAHRDDLPVIQTAFRGQFERCELSLTLDNPFKGITPESWDDIVFLDCFPPPPYSHLLTRPGELKVSTYRSLIAALMEIEPPAIGFYQALLAPVHPEHDWHRNVQALLDIEYTIKLMNGIQRPQSYLQQAPSGDLRQMAWEVETKAHDDKPFYAAAIRLGILGAKEQAQAYLQALAIFLNLFQHGGRPLNFITEMDYRKSISKVRITEMFLIGAAYRPGFLLNSFELAGFVHIPPAEILEYREPALAQLETLPVRNTDLYAGTPIGTCDYAGVVHRVCIPLGGRSRSTHIISRPGYAKSTTMGRMILDDIDKGMGVAVIDPHGDLVEVLLCLIKEEHIHKTIYFDPGDPDHVPLWNPLKRSPGQDISRTADDLVGAIKSVVTGWGDRLEHLLRHGLYALLQLPNSTLLDLSDLLRRKTEDSERLRNEILGVIDNQTAYQFWKNDFVRYPNEAFDPPKHKLSKLLVSGTVSLMLSQPENLIDFRRIMDDGMIFLVNLSRIGSEVREILGCFILSLFHLAALGRSDISIEKRKQFHIHADEAHRFLTEALEDLIAETRKYKVSLTLAHQYLSQFGIKKVDALSSVGTTIIMNVDGKDARYLTKDLRNLVQAEDLMSLKLGEAIARIGTEVVRVKLPGSFKIPERHFRDVIIERSKRLYYRPVQEVRHVIGRKDRRWDRPYAPLTPIATGKPKAFVYDEF